MSANKSQGIVIEDCENIYVGANDIKGYDEGIVSKNNKNAIFEKNNITSKESVETMMQVKAFIEELRSGLNSLQLKEEQTKEIQSDIETIEAQIQSPTPKVAILSACFKSVKNVLENAAGSVIATALIQNVDNILEVFS